MSVSRILTGFSLRASSRTRANAAAFGALLGAVLLFGALALGACTAASAAPYAVAVTPQRIAAQATINQFPLPPSITPLFFGGNVTAIPYGGQLPAGFVTAVPGSTGGNTGLGAQAAGTQAIVVVTATPNLATAAAQATQFALGTRFPTAARTPGNVTVTIPVGQIANTTQDIFGLLFAAVGSIIGGAWNLAGQYGGQLGQVVCCIGPAFFLAGYGFNRFRGTRRRGRG